ncbi:Gfo/Idh/MocA family oxidoreductase [Microlunatus sp. Y2014]|uniref:Gfo/Idh/MocA family oxidoreductase n=1 Tax=Microlunatus sp. Y2014 TaxID=3418488 RepID=UPI003DA7666B
MNTGRTRYAVVGAGNRVEMYLRAITTEHRTVAELVALLDTNPGRIDHHLAALDGVAEVVTGGPDRLEAVIGDHRVDRVIITTPDHTHADLIARSLHAGADVVVEKPLTIDPAGAKLITDAVAATGREVVTTFNYRYSPRNSALKQVITDGDIGTVLSVTFEWLLDTRHGADYFRRWHRDKIDSGGLLVHKASHHFDLVNWWLDDVPERVYASGGLKFYGDANADRYGFAHPHPRGTHDDPDRTPFELDLRTDPRLAALYLANEHHDGYHRDQDVFGPGITIEDTLAVVVNYTGGPVLSYALHAHAPWEGYRVSVNGTAGRAELEVIEAGRPKRHRLTVQRHWDDPYDVTIPEGRGGHGGGDTLLLSDLFVGPGDDPLARPASWRDGLRAASVGMAGNESLRTGSAIRIADLGLEG